MSACYRMPIQEAVVGPATWRGVMADLASYNCRMVFEEVIIPSLRDNLVAECIFNRFDGELLSPLFLYVWNGISVQIIVQWQGLVMGWEQGTNSIRFVPASELRISDGPIVYEFEFKMNQVEHGPPLSIIFMDTVLERLVAIRAPAGRRVSRADTLTGCYNGCGVSQHLKKCKGCKCAWYCSTFCQKAHWPKHKLDIAH